MEPIIDEDTFAAAQADRDEKRITKKNGRAVTSPLILSGLLKCGLCGSSMVAERAKSGKFVYYLCSRTKSEGKVYCPGTRIPAKKVESAVLEQMLEVALSPENVRRVIQQLRQSILAQQRPVKEIRFQLEEVQQRLQKYYDAFEKGTLDVEDVAVRFKELQREYKQLTAEYQERTQLKLLTEDDIPAERIKAMQGKFREAFTNGSPGVVKQYLGLLLENITARGNDLEVLGRTSGLIAAVETENEKRTADLAAVRNSSLKWVNTYLTHQGVPCK